MALAFNLMNITKETAVRITKVMSNTISIRLSVLLNIPRISIPEKVRFEYINAFRNTINKEYDVRTMCPLAPRWPVSCNSKASFSSGSNEFQNILSMHITGLQ
jgi:hypothetical protein